ncbi:hypothetical protein [Hoylesella shahii]|uniref:Uncharacterized protein n=1 Tax=Hoylesella shahii DSM 15611 = JCM 12083 TaxID=1122991 RepID=A0A318HYM3_9BACT|nr:hypothetical protein [Hoylesella shahii]PXX23634.1 hypothetical protein EJ73_00623 [Hoylesella shahii DSM 15611 = JCM 12083]
MSEIYWATRMDGINTFLISFIIPGGLLFLCFFILSLILDNSEKRERLGNALISVGYAISIAGVMLVFIPTTKEMLLIYGVGGTIDYIKSNDTAKELPDKAVKALDKYLDEISKDKEDEKDNVQR